MTWPSSSASAAIFSEPGHEALLEHILLDLDWKSLLAASATCTHTNDVVSSLPKLQLVLRAAFTANPHAELYSQGSGSPQLPSGPRLQRAIDIQRNWSSMSPKRVDILNVPNLYTLAWSEGVLATSWIGDNGEIGRKDGQQIHRVRDDIDDGDDDGDGDGDSLDGTDYDRNSAFSELIGVCYPQGWTVRNLYTHRDSELAAVPARTFKPQVDKVNVKKCFDSFDVSRPDNMIATANAATDSMGTAMIHIHFYLLDPEAAGHPVVLDDDGFAVPVCHPEAMGGTGLLEIPMPVVDERDAGGEFEFDFSGRPVSVVLGACGTVHVNCRYLGAVLFDWRTGDQLLGYDIPTAFYEEQSVWPLDKHTLVSMGPRVTQCSITGTSVDSAEKETMSLAIVRADSQAPTPTKEQWDKANRARRKVDFDEWTERSKRHDLALLSDPDAEEEDDPRQDVWILPDRTSNVVRADFPLHVFRFGEVGELDEDMGVYDTRWDITPEYEPHLDSNTGMVAIATNTKPNMDEAFGYTAVLNLRDLLNPNLHPGENIEMGVSAGIARAPIPVPVENKPWCDMDIYASSEVHIGLHGYRAITAGISGSKRPTNHKEWSRYTLHMADHRFKTRDADMVHAWPLGSRKAGAPTSSRLGSEPLAVTYPRTVPEVSTDATGSVALPALLVSSSWDEGRDEASVPHPLLVDNLEVHQAARPGTALEFAFAKKLGELHCVHVDAEHVYMCLGSRVVIMSF